MGKLIILGRFDANPAEKKYPAYPTEQTKSRRSVFNPAYDHKGYSGHKQ
jgi:hypothetical protein